jgi:hypothetical protein
MRIPRLLLPSLALAALTAGGCFIVSGSYLVSFGLPDPIVVDSATSIVAAQVDLTENSTYKDHKGDLKGVSDCAVLGTFSHIAGGAVDVEIWMTPDPTSHTTAAALAADATKIRVWGPFHLDASGAGSSRKIGWDEGARLFSIAGRAALVAQVKGDGAFTLYAVGASTPYSFKIDKGVFLAVVDAGK